MLKRASTKFPISSPKIASLVAFPSRRIYFGRPERPVEMVDFSLNLGYNDLYEPFCGEYLNWQGKLKLGLRQK